MKFRDNVYVYLVHVLVELGASSTLRQFCETRGHVSMLGSG